MMSIASLRILLVAKCHQHNDGQGRVNYEVALAALNNGMRVTLVTAYCAEDLAAHPNATVVFVGSEHLPTELLRNLAFANQSARWLREHRGDFDVIQANGFVTWEACDIVTAHFVHASWATNPSNPFARSVRPYSLYQRAFSLLNARWELQAFRTAERVIAVSESVAEDVRGLGVSPSRVDVVPNGVDSDEFRPGQCEREYFRLPTRVPMGLFVGDIRTPRKNLAGVLHVMTKFPDLHLAVAGDTKRSPGPELAATLGLSKRVHFIGHTSQIAKLMRSVDLFILPSRYEPFGLVAVEAAATGLPVILSRNVGAASALGDSCELIEHPDDEVGLARAVESLLHSPIRRRTLGEKARKRAMSLTWAAATEAYLDCFRSVVECKARRRREDRVLRVEARPSDFQATS